MISEQKVPYDVNLSLPFSCKLLSEAHVVISRKKIQMAKISIEQIVVFVDFPYLMQKYAMKINESISSFGEI